MQPSIRKQIKPYLDIPGPRVAMPEEASGERKSSFAEVEKGYPEEAALAEAKRCLGCRGCLGCGLCAVVCKPAAIDYSLSDEELEILADEVRIRPSKATLDLPSSRLI